MSRFYNRQVLFVTAFFLVSVFVLFLLPKSTLNQRTEQAEINSPHLSEQIQAIQGTLTNLQFAFKISSEESEKKKHLDALSVLFESVQALDSVAHYQQIFSTQYPKQEYLLNTAKAYYQSYRFALQPEKVKKMAERALIHYQKIGIPNLDLTSQVEMGIVTTMSRAPMLGVQIIKNVLEKDPKHQKALQEMGLLSMQSGQYQKAIQRWQQLLEIYPKDSIALYYMAIAFKKINKQEEAEKALNRLKSLQEQREM